MVSAEKEIVEASAAETKIVKDEADGALQQALPILEKAKSIVDALDKNSIVELKALNNPPPAVEMVMGCVMTMLGEKDVKWDVIKSVHIKEPAAFTMTDSQILSETFLEDLNNVLNTGEIPNLMQPDDKDRMQNELRTVITDPKKVETNDLCN